MNRIEIRSYVAKCQCNDSLEYSHLFIFATVYWVLRRESWRACNIFPITLHIRRHMHLEFDSVEKNPLYRKLTDLLIGRSNSAMSIN